LDRKEKAFKLLDSLKTIDCGIDAKRQLSGTFGVLNYYEENYTQAIQDFKVVISLSKRIPTDLNYNLLEGYTNIADAYLENKDHDLAYKYLDSTKSIITPNSNKELVTFYDELRFKLNYRTKENEEELLNEYLALIEENKKEHDRRINEELTALTLSNEKERVAIQQKNETEIRNITLAAVVGVMSLFVLIGFLIYKQRQFKYERQSLQMQQRLLRSQMNPHFMFNTLSVIQSQINKNQGSAEKYLLKFSRLLRLILENSLHNYVPVGDEIETLKKYLDLQLIRFQNKFAYNISLTNFDEDELIYIPPMLIQPFVENSIEHGFLGIDRKGEISIKLTLQEKWMSCVIEDNGKGLKTSASVLKTSVSINLISKFIKKVTKKSISIKDRANNGSSNESGVIVEFLIPYKFSNDD
jgi:hypothetical protein